MNTSIQPPLGQAITIGVIGVGRMGMKHILAAKQLGMIPVGIADVSPVALDSACSTHELRRELGFTDAIEMIRQTKPQALVIATTATTHSEYVLAAVELGVSHILCEKPMASSLDQADAMLEACERSNVKLAVNHQMRFMPHYNRVKELISGNELGKLSSIVVSGSNFGLAMNASHYFELFRYITESSVHSVQAWFDEALVPNPRGPQFQDRSGRLLARSSIGTVMYIDFAVTSGHGLQVSFICRNGQITVDELTGDLRVSARQAEYRELPTTRYGMPAIVRLEAVEPTDTVSPTMRLWSAMLEGYTFPDGGVGRHALACLVAAHISHEGGGCEVGLDDPSIPLQRVFPWA